MMTEMSLVCKSFMAMLSAIIDLAMMGLVFEPLFSIVIDYIMPLTFRKGANIGLEIFQDVFPGKNLSIFTIHWPRKLTSKHVQTA